MAYKTSREKMNERQLAAETALKAKARPISNATGRTGVSDSPYTGAPSGVPTHDKEGRKRVSTDKEWETLPEVSRPQDPPSVERALREGDELEQQDRVEAAQRQRDRAADKKIRRDPVLRKVKASVLAGKIDGANPLPTSTATSRAARRGDTTEMMAEWQRKQQEKEQIRKANSGKI